MAKQPGTRELLWNHRQSRGEFKESDAIIIAAKKKHFHPN